jgi:hypothetical protein
MSYPGQYFVEMQRLQNERRAGDQSYQLGRETSGQYNALVTGAETNWGNELRYPGLPPLSPRPPVKTFSTPTGERPNPAYEEWMRLAQQYREAAERPSPLLANEAYANETQRLSALSGLLNK